MVDLETHFRFAPLSHVGTQGLDSAPLARGKRDRCLCASLMHLSGCTAFKSRIFSRCRSQPVELDVAVIRVAVLECLRGWAG